MDTDHRSTFMKILDVPGTQCAPRNNGNNDMHSVCSNLLPCGRNCLQVRGGNLATANCTKISEPAHPRVLWIRYSPLSQADWTGRVNRIAGCCEEAVGLCYSARGLVDKNCWTGSLPSKAPIVLRSLSLSIMLMFSSSFVVPPCDERSCNVQCSYEP